MIVWGLGGEVALEVDDVGELVEADEVVEVVVEGAFGLEDGVGVGRCPGGGDLGEGRG